MSCSSDNPEQGTTIAKTRVTADGTYATESVFVSAAGSREDTKYVLENLSKTTKYEGILDNFCRLHIILRILSWTSLVVAQRVFPCVAVYEY